jgi:hypothetical protein
MHAKDPQFPKLAPGDRLGNQTKSNVRGILSLTYRGGIPQHSLPEDSPHRSSRDSGGEPAKQGPLQPGKDFRQYEFKDRSAPASRHHAGPSRDYDDYQIYN